MWNYRIIKREVEGQPDQYGLFEVFYNDDGEICGHSEDAEIYGESAEDIKDSLELMLKDVKKNFKSFFPPIVDEEKILKYGKIKFAPFYDENEKLIEVKDFKDFLKLTNINK